MPNHTHCEDQPDTSGGGMPLKRSKTTLPLKEKSFTWPPLPGRPRKVHKPLGRRVKTHVKEDY